MFYQNAQASKEDRKAVHTSRALETPSKNAEKQGCYRGKLENAPPSVSDCELPPLSQSFFSSTVKKKIPGNSRMEGFEQRKEGRKRNSLPSFFVQKSVFICFSRSTTFVSVSSIRRLNCACLRSS